MGRSGMGPVRADRLISLLLLSAVVASAFLVQYFGLESEVRGEWFLLTGLALIAEFLPVQVARQHLRITFALPYVAGMAVSVGPGHAVLLEVVVTVSVAVASASKSGGRTPLHQWAAHPSISVLSACFGVVCLAMIPSGSRLEQALAFTTGYMVANVALVALLEAVSGAAVRGVSGPRRYLIVVPAFVLHGLISMVVAILLAHDLGPLVVLTLAPVILLRGLVSLQERSSACYYDTITALTLMLQRAHPYTHGHLERVGKVAEEVALRLGLSPGRARLVREAAVLHDIGKIAVDEAILDAPHRLSDEEMDHVRRHSALGAEILTQSPKFCDVSGWILHHHERPDGKGYPYGLTDDEIPIESKIIAVADAYDAMTGGDADGERRAYRESLNHLQAIRELESCSGTQFDPHVVRAFRQVTSGGECR